MKELYRYSLKEATRLREIGKWRESHKENVRCREEIDRLVSENFDGMHLNGEIVKEICSEFGIDRTCLLALQTGFFTNFREIKRSRCSCTFD